MIRGRLDDPRAEWSRLSSGANCSELSIVGHATPLLETLLACVAQMSQKLGTR